jgi:hypothetical protein
MIADDLLLWLSATREGSWRQFRQAVEELNSTDGEERIEQDREFPLHQQLRLDLGRLAHVEFFALECEDGWRVAPPTLAGHSISGGVRAVLCGARSAELCDRLAAAAGKLEIETLNFPGAPQVIRVSAPKAFALAELSTHASVYWQEDAPLAILLQLPRCDLPSRQRNQSELPRGRDWTIRAFDSTRLGWRSIERPDVEAIRFGVLQFRIYFQQWRSFLRWNGLTFEMPRAVALYLLLHRHRRRILQYTRGSAALSLPAVCRPPLLLERALVLCSGVPPIYANGQITYTEVPPEVAQLAAQLLRQPLI